jgi:hypothetical protein
MIVSRDLSNWVAPTIAFRVEDFLVIKKKVLFGLKTEYEFEESVLKIVNYIFRRTDIAVDLVCSVSEFNPKLEAFLSTVPHNQIRLITKPVVIAIALNTLDLTYYVDDNSERRSIIGHKYCISLPEIMSILHQYQRRG